MTDQTEILIRFRRVILSRIRIRSILGILFAIIGFVFLWLMPAAPFLWSFLFGWSCLCLSFLLHSVLHGREMLKHLEPRYTDAFERLERILNDGQIQWEKFSVARIIGSCALALIMLFLLLFYKESKWAAITSSSFILLLLASMIKGWLNFSDQILLHDIRRSLRDRDQISE